ncbi:MAG: hypothetical protein AB1422_14915, partial [bacterium]
MKRIILCILLLLCGWSSKVSSEELTWGSCTTYAPMPVLFIHGINSNCKTWDTAIPELEKYFQYRQERFNEPNYFISPFHPTRKGVTYFKDEKTNYESPAKLYLEAFDYGGEDAGKSFNHLDTYSDVLKRLIEGDDKSPGILKSYYGDNYNPTTDKLIIVAHSQGGLIARHYIQEKDGWKHVKRLITIGTAHTGSWLADKLIRRTREVPESEFIWILQEMAIRGLAKILKVEKIEDIEKGAIQDQQTELYQSPISILGHAYNTFLWHLNNGSGLRNLQDNVEVVCIVGKIGKLFYKDSDAIVSGNSQRGESEILPVKYFEPISIIDIKDGLKGFHGNQTNQWDKIRQSLDGIPDKGTKTYDTPCVTLGTSTVTPGTYSLYYLGSSDNFYITGKIQDYIPASCSITVEIDSEGNYASDKDGQIKERQDLIQPIDMNTESQELPQKPAKLNASFNFHPTNLLTQGSHTFRVTIKNPAGLIGTSTTKEGFDWIPFMIVGLPVVEVPIQKSASPATPIAGGFQAASSLFFWDNQNNYWERWINSNLRVDSDNIIRYNAGTSNLDNPNLRHRVYLESRIYPAGSIYPKASCVNKKETQAITYTYASPPFKLLPFTKADNTVVYRPDVDDNGTITYPEDMVTFTNNEVIFTPKKDALPNLNFGPIIPGNPMYTYPLHIIIPPEYQGVSSHELDIYINQVGGLYALESLQKAFDYSQALSSQQGFNPTINIAWAQNADLTNDGITGFG